MLTAIISWPGVIIIGCMSLVLVTAMLLGRSILISKTGISVLAKDSNKKPLPLFQRSPNKIFIIIDALRRAMEYSNKETMQKFISIAQQMDAYDEAKEEAIAIMKTAYSNLLKAKLQPGESFALNKEYVAFDNLLEATFGDLSKLVRRWFKSNHYALRTTDEQLEYIRCKKEIISQEIAESFDRRWSGVLVTYQELADEIHRKEESWMKSIENVLNRAFTIARVQYERKEMLDESFFHYIRETFGDEVRIRDESNLNI